MTTTPWIVTGTSRGLVGGYATVWVDVDDVTVARSRVFPQEVWDDDEWRLRSIAGLVDDVKAEARRVSARPVTRMW